MVHVSDSIVNASSASYNAKDIIQPFTFIEFIAQSSLTNNESAFLTEYKEYLIEWANVKNNKHGNISTGLLIKQQVINMLKTLIISFTNEDEQRFLASLNWNFDSLTDEDARSKAKNSIYSALPLFVSRIKEIALFYKDKRTEATFTVNRNKIRGTKKSIEKIIFDNILSFLFSKNSDKIEYVQSYLNISIDNYVDTYSEYFDIDRSKNVPTSDYNDIDPTIYFELEQVLADMLFNGDVYLREIPLIAQLAIDLSQECVGDMLTLKEQLIADSTIGLITNDEKVRLRKRLYEKYIGTDFYYLYKDGDNYVTDVFIKAENPSNNLLNQQTIDTPYTVSTQLKLLKNIGLFFKPDKLSLLRVDATNFSYSINTEQVEDGKLYIFPDPKIYGNVSFNRQADYPLIFEYTYDQYIKTSNFGKAGGDPLVTSDAQALFAYYSREQDINKINKDKLIVTEFSDLYNKGFIAQTKLDLDGNRFALYKNTVDKFKTKHYYNPEHPDIIPGTKNTVDVSTGIITQIFKENSKYQTELRTDLTTVATGDNELTRDDIAKVPGQLYVFNAITQKSSLITEALPWLSDENYLDIINNIVSFDIIENLLIIRARLTSGKIMFLFDCITTDVNTGKFKRIHSQKSPIIFRGETEETPSFNDKTFKSFNEYCYPTNYRYYNKVSDVIYTEMTHKCYFVALTLDYVTKNNITYPVSCPEIYEINIDGLTSKRYFFKETNNVNEQQIESFSIPDTILDNTGTVLACKVSDPTIAYSSDTNSFMIVYTVQDMSNNLFVFKHYMRLIFDSSSINGIYDDRYTDSTIYYPSNGGLLTIIPPLTPDGDYSGGTTDGDDSEDNAIENLLFVINNIIN